MTRERLQTLIIITNYVRKHISRNLKYHRDESFTPQCLCPTINNYSTLAELLRLFFYQIPRSLLRMVSALISRLIPRNPLCGLFPYPQTPHVASLLVFGGYRMLDPPLPPVVTS